MVRPDRLSRIAIAVLATGTAGCTTASEPVASPVASSVTATTVTTVTAAPTMTSAATATTSGAADGLYPDVVDAVARRADDGTWTFDVTLSSPYDSPERYADGWRVLGPNGEQLGVRELGHDHATEQPFTRSLDGVVIPDGIGEVTIEGRDQRNGWGGATKTVALTN